MSTKDVNKIWRQAGRKQLICPQDATAHILAMEMAERKPQLLIHCDLRFLFLSAADPDQLVVNQRAIRLLETAERAGRKISPFDWLDSQTRRAHRLLEIKPKWKTITAHQFMSDVMKRGTGQQTKAELAITSKCFGTKDAHVTVAINPATLMK